MQFQTIYFLQLNLKSQNRNDRVIFNLNYAYNNSWTSILSDCFQQERIVMHNGLYIGVYETFKLIVRWDMEKI